jgi:predicted dehydrogenase
MVGIAVVGAGNWGKNLVRTFAGLPGVDLRSICDLDPRVREGMARLYPGARVVADPVDALADPALDAVVVAVDAPRHFAIASQALESGRHVLVEKPLALSAADAGALVELAERRRVKLMTGHLLEYHPAVTAIKQMLARGELGQPHYLYCQRLNLGVVRQNENAWWSLAPHDISVACFLFESEPVSVSVTGHAYLQPGIEDVVFASLTFADGRMAHVHVSWLDPHKTRQVTLVASQKMVVFDDMDASEKIRIYDKRAEVQRSVDSYVEAITLRTGDILIPRVDSAEPLKLECQHFVDCIVEDRQPRSDGQDGLRVVKVLEAGARSLANGGTEVRL